MVFLGIDRRQSFVEVQHTIAGLPVFVGSKVDVVKTGFQWLHGNHLATGAIPTHPFSFVVVCHVPEPQKGLKAL